MRKQKQKAYPRSSRGQTTLQSFLFKPSGADGELNSPPHLPAEDEDEIPTSRPAPPKREIVRVTNKTIKEKTSAFSSVGSSGAKNAGGASALNAAVFRRFDGSSPPAARAECSAEAGGDADDDGGASGSAVRLDVDDIAAGSRRRPESRKRKSPLGSGNARHVVVLGDDPKPRPLPSTRRGRGRGPARSRSQIILTPKDNVGMLLQIYSHVT